MLIIMKFGGSSLATNEKIEHAARLIAHQRQAGNQIVVVVSAQGDTTDRLAEKAACMAGEPSLRECDVLLSSGEQVSMSLMAMKLSDMGCEAVSLCGWQAGIYTDNHHGNANITYIDTNRILDELSCGKTVIVAGFQGLGEDNDITTLGRGGSDTTAIALGAALKADACFIYTDVPGVYSADPRVVKDAVMHSEISYDEMLEMSSLGARVLHNRSVLMAKRSKLKIEVLSSDGKEPGTLVHELAPEKYVSGIVCDRDVAMISVIGVDSGETTCRLFKLLVENGVQVDIIIRSPSSFQGRGVISFSVIGTMVPKVQSLLRSNKLELKYEQMVVEENLAKISAVGSGLADSCIVASQMLLALSQLGLEPNYITTGEIRISVLIPEAFAAEAEKAIHSALISKAEAGL